MTPRLAVFDSTLRVRVLALLLAGLLGGCVHQDVVTVRPPFAFPQHMTPLCGREWRLVVSNRGEFYTADSSRGANAVLLSAQLAMDDLVMQRLISHLELQGSDSRGINVHAYDGSKRWLFHTIAAEHLHCDGSGAMLLEYPPDSFYFWASVGKKERSLALWSNKAGDLVVQNRWLEEHTGLISGEVSGDAWALFKAGTPPPVITPELTDKDVAAAGAHTASCADLSGYYSPTAEVVHADGSLDSRSAVDQFFRKEIVGEQPLNLEPVSATQLRLSQDAGNGITLSLYDGPNLLGERHLPTSALTCQDSRWLFKGEKTMHSAWLLLAASGGVHWEDLTLWRDHTGALLVEGRHTQRTLLMLIPFGGTDTLLMAFPPQ